MHTKRLIAAVNVLALFFNLFVSVPSAFAQSATAATLARVSPSTISFDPTKGERANIQYRVTEGNARNVTVDLYYSAPARSSDPGLCNRSNQFFVSTIEGPVDHGTGTYTATWNGLLRDGTPEIQGNYCYHIQWSNPQIGALGFIDGLVELRQSGGSTGSASGGTSVGSGGTTGGTTGGTGGGTTGGTSGGSTGGTSGGTTGGGSSGGATNTICSAPYGFVDSRIDTNTVDVRTHTLANITYRACTGIPRGSSFSFGIYDDRGVPIRLYFSHNQGVAQGYTQTLSWNGTSNNGGDVLENKTYFYKFKINGLDDSVGSINVVKSATTSQPPTALTLTHSVSPSTIQVDSVRTVSLNTALINFEANQTMSPSTALSVVLDQGPGLTTTLPLFTTNRPLSFGSASWSGFIGSGLAAAGTYRYVIRLDGQTLGTGFITVQNIQQPQSGNAPVITDRGPDPATITVGGSTNFRFHLSQTANATLNIYEPIFENTRVIRSITMSRPSGETSIAFDGRDQNGNSLQPNVYTYELRASNAQGEATPRRGTFRVDSTSTDTPFITDLGPDRFTFDASRGERATFSFRMNRSARVDFSIFDSNDRFVRNLLTSSQANNTNAGLNTVQWDGRERDGSGAVVSEGLYTYVISAIGGNTVRGTVRVQRTGGTSLMDVSNLTATPDPFNPSRDSGIDLGFTLNNSANVTVTVFQDLGNSNFLIKRLLSNAALSSGTQRVRWDGRDENGRTVGFGTYLFVVDASNSLFGSDSDSRRFSVSVSTGQGDFQISDLRAFPNPFDPDEDDKTEIRFRISESARITVRIMSERNGDTVRTLTSDRVYSDREVSILWDGADRYGSTVADGKYNVIVEGRSERQGAFDSKAYIVTVDSFGGRDGTGRLIKNHSAHPTTFNPQRGESTTITFTTRERPRDVRVEILTDSTRALIANLVVEEMDNRTYRARWNGRDYSDNDIVPTNRQYRYFITVRQGSETDTATGIVYASSTSSGKGNCGNFQDVYTGNGMCDAIQFVVDRGIFKGYPDGTIGLNNVIQRAEMAAVLQKLFQYDLQVYDERNDRDLGYADLRGKERQWYMPYLKTFINHRLMVGYPDGHMRPERTMNTAELYLVFFKAAQQSPKNAANFTIDPVVRYAPYRDTPLTRQTEWYIRYAAFAQLNGLVTGDYFNPGKGITRGQVIKLIYDSYNKGLITCPEPGFYDNFRDSDYYIYYNDTNRYDYKYYDNRNDYRDEDRYSRDQYGSYYRDRNGNYYYRDGSYYRI